MAEEQAQARRALEKRDADTQPVPAEIMEVYRELGIESREARERLTRLNNLPQPVVRYRLVTRFTQNTEPLAREG